MRVPQRMTSLLRSPIVIIALLAMLGVNALLLVLYNESKNDAYEASVKTLDTLAFALAEHVQGTFEHADTLLKQDRYTYLNDRANLGRQFEGHNRSVDRESFPLEALIKADGFMYLSSTYPSDFAGAARVDLSDRAHFSWQARADRDDVFVSTAITGRVSGKPVINMTRRIEGPDGRFEGVAVVSISPDNFISPYRHIVGDSGVVAIYGLDGIARVRITKDKTQASLDVSKSAGFQRMRSESQGHLVMVSEVDGEQRLYAFRALKGFPLIVSVGFGLEEMQVRYGSGMAVTVAWRFLLTNLVMGSLLALALWSQILRRRIETANRVLTQKEREASAANLAKTRLIASVSHELRTPLHGIMGHAQLLTFAAPPGPIREDAEGILKSAQHLHEIVDELLDVAKAESGAQSLHWQFVDLEQLVREVANLHTGSASLKGLELSLHCELEGAPPFMTDPVVLRRVLHNLLSNAVKFTASGTVTLIASMVPEGVSFAVLDSGVGIGPQAMVSLFEPFGTSTSSTDGNTPGTGLGLALSERLVRSLGGKLHASSAEGVGTSLMFALPLREQPPAEQGVA